MRMVYASIACAALIAAAAGATETTPEAAAFFNKGAELANAGKYDEALAQFEKSLTEDPELVEAEEWIASIHLARGDAAAAIERYKKALARRPSAALKANLGLAYLQTGDTANALKVLNEAVAADPKSPAAWNSLTTAYLKTDKVAEAENSAGKALALDDGYAPAHVNLGNVYLRKGDAEAAITSFRKGLALDGTQINAYYGLGEAYSFLGSNKEAGDNYLLYLKNGGRDGARKSAAVGWLWDHGRGAEVP
jgi:Tfp pilus assembly protein PilF